jgi:hypothetical protein
MSMKEIIETLRGERTRIEQELKRVGSALTALGVATKSHSHRLSADARRRIADAQRARWAKTRLAKTKEAKVTAISAGWTPARRAQGKIKQNQRKLQATKRRKTA